MAHAKGVALALLYEAAVEAAGAECCEACQSSPLMSGFARLTPRGDRRRCAATPRRPTVIDRARAVSRRCGPARCGPGGARPR